MLWLVLCEFLMVFCHNCRMRSRMKESTVLLPLLRIKVYGSLSGYKICWKRFSFFRSLELSGIYFTWVLSDRVIWFIPSHVHSLKHSHRFLSMEVPKEWVDPLYLEKKCYCFVNINALPFLIRKEEFYGLKINMHILQIWLNIESNFFYII